MKRALAVLFAGVSLAANAGGCSGASPAETCPPDPACYAVSTSGECSLDPDSACVAGSWKCGPHGTLASGCLPDGGLAPPPVDAGACPLASLQPPLACTDDATCAPYGGHCEYPSFNGPGECVCGPAVTGPDACAGPGCAVCSLPSFTIACSGPGDATCAQYGAAYCAETPAGSFACSCEYASDPPSDCTCVCGDPCSSPGAQCDACGDGFGGYCSTSTGGTVWLCPSGGANSEAR